MPPPLYVPLPQEVLGKAKEQHTFTSDDTAETRAIDTIYPMDTLSGRWAACVVVLLVVNALVLALAATTLRRFIRDLALRLEAVDTRDLPRPDTLFGLMK
ncbi:hypothetical protein GY45DRAFT_1374955 [Cubamyces sp. BRFM 1775]|nr:hypothetical protein GY45DRAFT_1374955 [Cubamyces sp. BRFM 1775]